MATYYSHDMLLREKLGLIDESKCELIKKTLREYVDIAQHCFNTLIVWPRLNYEKDWIDCSYSADHLKYRRVNWNYYENNWELDGESDCGLKTKSDCKSGNVFVNNRARDDKTSGVDIVYTCIVGMAITDIQYDKMMTTDTITIIFYYHADMTLLNKNVLFVDLVAKKDRVRKPFKICYKLCKQCSHGLNVIHYHTTRYKM